MKILQKSLILGLLVYCSVSADPVSTKSLTDFVDKFQDMQFNIFQQTSLTPKELVILTVGALTTGGSLYYWKTLDEHNEKNKGDLKKQSKFTGFAQLGAFLGAFCVGNIIMKYVNAQSSVLKINRS